MSCTDFEIRDYFLDELPEADKRQTARHLASCSRCASELEGLRHLRFALESVPDQEPPQRIGFVSDKIFEPSRARRIWNSFWHSGPQLGFASAAMLSAALVFFAMRPAPAVRLVERPVAAATETSASMQPLIDAAVRKAVAETEVRQQQRTDALLAVAQRKYEKDQRDLILRVADSFTMLQKRALVNRASLLTYGGGAQ